MVDNQEILDDKNIQTAYARLQALINNCQDKAERLAYAAGKKTNLQLIHPETKELLKPLRFKSERDMAKAYEKVFREAVDNLRQVINSAKSTDLLKTGVDDVCDSLETQLGILNQFPGKLAATKARLFLNEAIEPIPTGNPVITSTTAQLRHDFWDQDSSGIAFYRQEAKRNPKNFVEHYITSPGDIRLLPFKDAQNIIDQLGFNTAKLQLVFAAHAMDVEKPWESSFIVKGTDVIKELGWDKRTDVTLSKKLTDIANAAFALDCLLVKAVWEEGRDKKGRIIASVETSRMWNTAVKMTGQTGLLVEGRIDEPHEVYLTVCPGLWTKSFLNKPGWESRQALYQFGYLAQDVLKIDPYHDELALRLAIHLTIESRFHQSGEYRVKNLLELALPIPEIEISRSNFRKSYDLKQRWDNALMLLMRLEWQINFDEQTYPEWLRPGSHERNRRGYFDKLLGAKITIKPIPAIQARLKRCREFSPPKLLHAAPSTRLTGVEIRKARDAKGWTQRKLAGFLNVSQSLLANWETGRRTPDKDKETHIRKLLNI
jgi:DNA-binding transcriptional regulator YiaG